jgi:hypothetical protein
MTNAGTPVQNLRVDTARLRLASEPAASTPGTGRAGGCWVGRAVSTYIAASFEHQVVPRRVVYESWFS